MVPTPRSRVNSRHAARRLYGFSLARICLAGRNQKIIERLTSLGSRDSCDHPLSGPAASKRRWFRFSLPTLFVAVTVFAALSAILALALQDVVVMVPWLEPRPTTTDLRR
jgi:hypothetical protein